MARFPYDRDTVDEAMHEGHQIMADLVARLRRAEVLVARLRDEQEDLRDRLRDAKRMHDAGGALMRITAHQSPLISHWSSSKTACVKFEKALLLRQIDAGRILRATLAQDHCHG